MSARARSIREYFKHYRWSFAGGIFFLVCTQAFALTVPQILRVATDALVGSDLDTARTAAIQLVGVAIGGTIVRILSRILIFNAGRQVEFAMRNDLFTHLSGLSPSFFGRMPTGQIMSRAVNDLTQVRLLLGPGLLNLTNTALVYAVVVPLLLIADWELALYCLSALPALIFVGRVTGRKIYELGHEAQERLGGLSNMVQQNLGGVMTVRAYHREAAEEQRFASHNERYFDVNMRLARLRGALFPLMGLFGSFGVVVLLWLGGRRMIDGRMTVGEFVQFNAYLSALFWPTIALGWMISLWQRGLASMDRINDVFTAAPEITEGRTAPSRQPAGEIEIRRLTFTYAGGAQPALRDVSVCIRPGETVVIVGRTGSGKSTMLRAISRLIEVDENRVFLDGTDVRALPVDTVRSLIAYAPQDAFLFSRTLHENVSFGVPEASAEDVRRAVRRAGLEPDVAGFPDGLETIVGERGITLSGGQRQRTALARALLVNAPILLLDDTLAAVDTETENKILSELARDERRTTIMVTHRLAAAANADRIIVMDEGRIAEEGAERELLMRNGIYAEMHRRQRLRDELESRPPEPGTATAMATASEVAGASLV